MRAPEEKRWSSHVQAGSTTHSGVFPGDRQREFYLLLLYYRTSFRASARPLQPPLHPGRRLEAEMKLESMSKRVPSPEAEGRRHKLRVLDGYAAVVLTALLVVAVGDAPIEPVPLAFLILVVSRAVFGVVDRMPRWKGERR